MDRFAQSLAAFLLGRGEWFVYGALVVALLAMRVSKGAIRGRLRAAVVLGALYGVVDLALRGFPERADDFHVLELALGALCLARVSFVLVVDVGIERGGRAPINALFKDLAQLAVYAAVVAVVLRAAQVNTTGILATGTVVTAIVGLALQETLGHLAAGLSLQIDRPIGVGDWIHLDKIDVYGRVVATNWRSVTVETDDRNQMVVPNGVFTRSVLVNHSRPSGPVRRSLYLVLPFEVPPAHARALLEAACRDCPSVLADPAPSVFTWRVTERGVEYWLRFFVADFGVRDRAQSEVMTRVWYEAHRRKISFALPREEHLVRKVNEGARLREEEEAVRDRRAAIDGVDFLAPLSPDAKDRLAERGHRRLFGPGEVVVREGDSARSFYLVRRGEVEVRSGEVVLRRLGPGELFGELALFLGGLRTASVVAQTETEVFEIDDEMFRDVLQREPKVAQAISEIVARRRAELAAVPEEGPASVQQQRGLAAEVLEGLRRVFGI